MSKVVSQVLYYNQAQQYPQIQQDYSDVKNKMNQVNTLDQNVGKALLCAVPTFRRTSSFEDKINKGDFIPAAGIGAIALMQLPEDLNDLGEGFKHVKSFLTGTKYEAKYENKVAQHEFSFLRNTLLEKWYKKTNSETVKKVVRYLRRGDKALYSTNLGKKIQNLMGIEKGEQILTKMKNDLGKTVVINKIEAKGLFGDFTARAMKRTTVLGLGALAVLEIPKILKAMNEGNNIAAQSGNIVKQTIKSSINVASVTASIAYGGAIGAKHGKALGSLVGMGAGAVFGSLISNKAQGLVN